MKQCILGIIFYAGITFGCSEKARDPEVTQGHPKVNPTMFGMTSLATIFRDHPVVTTSRIAAGESFLVPNEHNPEDMKELLTGSRRDGVVVSTGSVRALFTLGFTPGATGLLVVDNDPIIKQYHDAHTWLIANAENKEDYLKLSKMKYSDLPRSKLGVPPFNEQQWELVRRAAIDPALFAGGKELYIGDDDTFTKIQQLARRGQIVAITDDVSNMEAIITKMQTLGRPTAVIDVSNIPEYLTPDSYARLRAAVPEGAKLIATSHDIMLPSQTRYFWGYFEVGKDGRLIVPSSQASTEFEVIPVPEGGRPMLYIWQGLLI